MATFSHQRLKGFTLAELLVVLSVLGIIAMFTIPKLMTNAVDEKYNAMAKEAAALMTETRLRILQDKGRLDSSVTYGTFIQYMNHVKLVDSGTKIDYFYTATSPSTCTNDCVLFQNGAVARIGGGYCNPPIPEANCGVLITLDPDGIETIPGNGYNSGKGVQLWIYQNGLMRSRGNTNTPTYSSNDTSYSYNPCPGCDPPWFHWN